MTATAVDERTQLPGPTWPPSAPPPASFPLTDRRAVLADDPCEAGFSGADPKYAGMYLHARYFDPQLGTFLSPDPIGVAGGMNLYGYGFGDPVNRVDRTGLDPCRVVTDGPGAGQPRCQGTYVDVRPADEYDPAEALMDLIRGGMLLMDGVQKMLTSRKAIEQERRIMQADIDEQDRLAAEAARQNSTTTTTGNEGEGSAGGSEVEVGGGVSGIVGVGPAVSVAVTFDTATLDFDLELSAGLGVGWDVGASATGGWEWAPVDPKLVISTNASAGLITGSVIRSGAGTPVRGIQGGIQTPGLGLSRTWSREMTLRGGARWFKYSFLLPAMAYLHPRPF